MQQPTRLISTPFAQEGEKTQIQNVTGEFDNSATYRLGFPPLTMQSIRLGGKPPKGTDFNGILFDITENISFLCKGGRYQYNAGLSTLIGGYPEGSNLLLDDNVTEVVSTVAGNQNDPNTNMAGWILKPNKTTAANVADASGLSQQEINDSFKKVSLYTEMPTSAKEGDVCYVVELDSWFLYTDAKWVLNEKDIVDLSKFPRLNAELDDTNRFYRAIASSKFYSVDSPSGYACFTMTKLVIPAGVYLISDQINLPTYFTSVTGVGKPIIKQSNNSKIILNHPDVWSFDVSNIKFVGGKHHVYLANDNRDASVFNIKNCEHHSSSDYPIYTIGTSLDSNHLSAKLSIGDCKFIKTNGVLHNVCDCATISGGWLYIDKSNFTADRAVIKNLRGMVQMTDGVMCVPKLGTGVDRLSRVRWVDNHGRFYADGARFGGEDHGIPIVYQQTKEVGITDSMGASIVIKNSQTYAGLRSNYGDDGASVVYFDTDVPQQIVLGSNYYQLSCPYITCNPSINLDAFFDEVSGAQARYKFHIENIMELGSDAFADPIPVAIRRFTNGGMVDKLMRPVSPKSTVQLANHFKIVIPLDNHVRSFGYLVSVATNFLPAGSDKYRKNALFYVGMVTEYDGVSVKNILKTSVVARPEGVSPAADIMNITSCHFGSADTGSSVRNETTGGDITIMIENCKDLSSCTILSMIES